MKHLFSLFLIPLILAAGYLIIIVASASAQGTHLSDYQFQIDRYRQNYAEYQNFKSDYGEHPTLNNEQKAVLSAKQSIISRELAWGNFVFVLADSIRAPQVSYPLIDKSLGDLEAIASYHLSQAVEAEKINTRSDLTAFTKQELFVTKAHILPLAQAQVANKLAQLIKFQINAKTAYDSLLPILESKPNDLTIRNGLDQVNAYSQQINEQIDSLATKTAALDLTQGNQDQFYSNTSETLAAIRTLQNRLVGVIIDLDTNYVLH